MYLPAWLKVVVDQKDANPRARGFSSRGKTGGTCTDDEELRADHCGRSRRWRPLERE